MTAFGIISTATKIVTLQFRRFIMTQAVAERMVWVDLEVRQEILRGILILFAGWQTYVTLKQARTKINDQMQNISCWFLAVECTAVFIGMKSCQEHII